MSLQLLRQKQKMKKRTGSDGSMAKDYSLGYLAKSDSLSELSVAAVLSTLGLQVGSPFSEDGNATLEDVEIDRLETLPPHCRWTVSINYSTTARMPQSDTQDPTQWRVKRSKGYREVSRNILKDKDGNMVLNAANDPFEGGIPVTDYMWVYNYEWNRNIPTPSSFQATLNLNTFNGCAPFTLLCLIKSEEVYEGSYHYWKEQIEMQYDKDGWKPKPVNAGFNQFSRGGKVQILDTNGQPFADAQPLYDGTVGGKPAGTMVPISDRPAGCVFKTIEHYQISDFANIGVQQFP